MFPTVGVINALKSSEIRSVKTKKQNHCKSWNMNFQIKTKLMGFRIEIICCFYQYNFLFCNKVWLAHLHSTPIAAICLKWRHFSCFLSTLNFEALCKVCSFPLIFTCLDISFFPLSNKKGMPLNKKESISL